MKTVDQIFGWIMFILGLVHAFFAFRAHGLTWSPAYSAVIIILLAGLINVSRAQAPKGLIKCTSIFANIAVIVPSALHTFTLHAALRENLQVPVLLGVAFIELLFAIWG